MIDKNVGYYLCNGVSFSSKIDACIYSKTVNQPVEWMFHQDQYANYSWHIEPQETLDQLYDQRTKELREQYDYIILSYSGGSDTNNILESFIRQGLHIDEIVTNHITDATKHMTIIDANVKDNWNFAAEHQLQAVPRLQYIRNKLPKTKITVLDVSNVIIDSMKIFDDAEWVLGRNDYLSIGQLFRYNYFHFNEMKKQFDKNLKIAIIVGVDKVKTYIDDNNDFYLYFNDNTASVCCVNDFNTEYTNIKTELFYWAPSTASLVCKQAHTVKKWLESNPDQQHYWKTTSFTTSRLYQERILRPLLYPTTWDDSWYQADKGTAWWHSEFDFWFRKNSVFEREYRQWRMGINYLVSQLPEMIVYNSKGAPDSLKRFTHDYYVGKLYNKYLI
jgi:hypothetical protein